MNFEELSERQCFEEHEPILQEENHTYEYKHFAVYSANAQLNELTLLKTICGMLNCFGGYIFIGIKENQEGGDIRREVVGYAFN
jgi:predicted HTH transcriptional regulator